MKFAHPIAPIIVLISSLFSLPIKLDAQDKPDLPGYDYYSLAIRSILSSASEGSKLPDVPQRVGLLINAAQILPMSEHDEAVRLLELGLHDLKEWGSDEKATWYQRHEAATLRTQVLALYTKLDSEKAIAFEKEFQKETEQTPSKTSTSALKSNRWSSEFTDRRTAADQTARIALSLLDTDRDKALILIRQSLQAGSVSGVLIQIVQKLLQDRNRLFLNTLEISIGDVLASNYTLDHLSLSFTSALLQTDTDMPAVTKRAFASFYMSSLQIWSNLVREESVNGGLDTSYINAFFTIVSISVRPALLQIAPGYLTMLDSILDGLGPLIPAKTRLRLQAFQPETLSDPRDRLNDILKDLNSEKRDLRLIRFVSELLHPESEDVSKNLDLAAEGVDGFSDRDIKAAFTDLLTIVRINVSLKQRNFIEAQRVARSISLDETRAWALLALSSVATRTDRVLGFELISDALASLDKTSPSPHKVELALIAVGMLAKSDPQRAFDTLSAASRYANSSVSKIDPPAKPPVAFGLEATIGEATTRLGVFPENLGEVKIDPSLSTLGTSDWFRANQIADSIREPALRLRLRLAFAQAMIAEGPKPKKKEPTKKPSE